MMTWKVIKTKAEYNKAIKRTMDIFQMEPGTPEADELDLLLVLVKAYEDKHIVLPAIDPIDAIKLKMKEQGIRNDDQYENALARVYSLMQKSNKPGSAASDELEVLTMLIKEYENEHYPVPKASPLEAIRFRLDQMNMSEAELSEILGYRSRKSEILSGKRKLNLSMIRKIADKLHIPAEVLIQAY